MMHLQLLAWYTGEIWSELLVMGSAEEPKLDVRKRTRAGREEQNSGQGMRSSWQLS